VGARDCRNLPRVMLRLATGDGLIFVAIFLFDSKSTIQSGRKTRRIRHEATVSRGTYGGMEAECYTRQNHMGS
jgi:hypothetical protein